MRLPGLLACTLVVTVACAAPSGSPADSTTSSATVADDGLVTVTLQLADYAADMPRLRAHDVDIAGVSIETNRVDVVTDEAGLRELADDGFTVMARRASTPQTISGYKSPAAVATIVADLAARFPQIARATSIGQSHEGRPIWALEVRGSGSTAAPRPAVVFNGGQHAREVMGVEVALDTMETLLTGYGVDPRITHWVDANRIWIVPMVNPDGSHRVTSGSPLWRKNARGCPASGSCPSGTGVDINRNFSHGWGACNGSSGTPSSDSYRGPEASSEPETRAIMGLVEATRPVLSLSYHAYSEFVLYPYGCEGSHVAERGLLEGLGRTMAGLLPSDAGGGTYRSGTPWELLYSVDGGANDWMYATHGVLPFTIEISAQAQGFQPTYAQWRDRTVRKLRAAWQLLLDRLDAGGVRGVVRDTAGRPLANAVVELVTEAGSQTRKTGPDGVFHILTDAQGNHRLNVRAAGHSEWGMRVRVGDRRTDLEITVP